MFGQGAVLGVSWAGHAFLCIIRRVYARALASCAGGNMQPRMTLSCRLLRVLMRAPGDIKSSWSRYRLAVFVHRQLSSKGQKHVGVYWPVPLQ